LNIVPPEDLTMEPDVLCIWPDNWLPMQVFRRMLTQWNVGGLGGVVGLRYEALPVVLQACAVPRRDWGEVVDCLQVMERRALAMLNET
jgi:hypothetical protein